MESEPLQESAESLLSLQTHTQKRGHVNTQQDDSHLQTKRKLQNEIFLVSTLTLDVLAFKTVRNKCLWLKPPAHGALIWQPELAKTGTQCPSESGVGKQKEGKLQRKERKSEGEDGRPCPFISPQKTIVHDVVHFPTSKFHQSENTDQSKKLRIKPIQGCLRGLGG